MDLSKRRITVLSRDISIQKQNTKTVRYTWTTIGGSNVFVRQLFVFQKMAILEDNLKN